MAVWLVFQNHITFMSQTHLTIRCHCTVQFDLSYSSLYNDLFNSTSVLTDHDYPDDFYWPAPKIRRHHQ